MEDTKFSPTYFTDFCVFVIIIWHRVIAAVEEPCVAVQLQTRRVHTAWHAHPFLPTGHAMEAHTSQTYTVGAEDELKRNSKLRTAAFPCFVL